MTIKALSIREPWASLIASGRKTIELRTWSVKYRGPLLICSGLRPYRGAAFPRAPEKEVEVALARPRGVAVAIVQLLDVRPATPHDAWAACSAPDEGEFAWILGDAQLVPAVPIKGKLGLFGLDWPAILAAHAAE